MAFRTKHKVHRGGYVYVVRNQRGQITDVQNIGRAIRQDSARASNTVPAKPRQGFMGDYASSGIVTRVIKNKKLY